MGFFTEGYEQGVSLQQGKCEVEEYEKNLKNLLKTAKYKECVEWYNGFYKGMLDYELAKLQEGFSSLKKEAESDNLKEMRSE